MRQVTALLSEIVRGGGLRASDTRLCSQDWKPKWDLETALRSRYVEYVASGRAKKEKAFPEDEIILNALGVSR